MNDQIKSVITYALIVVVIGIIVFLGYTKMKPRKSQKKVEENWSMKKEFIELTSLQDAYLKSINPT
jgi:uncharacterized membrane protein